MNTIEKIKRAVIQGKLSFNGIPLASVQASGTSTQKASHAKLIATRVYEKIQEL